MSGLLALLDDVAAIAKVAAASVDDVIGMSAKAGTKVAGVVIDDAAVTPNYVHGLAPARELPIIWKIGRASVFNKLVILLPVALLLSSFAPWIITPLLMLGGCYLSFEGAEKIFHVLFPHADEKVAEDMEVKDPGRLEEQRVRGAIKTDFILSAEIMTIILANVDVDSLWLRAAVLAVVGVAVTVAVYGAVALIVKMDDLGVAMATRGRLAATRAAGRGLVKGMPHFMTILTVVGTAAMIWVGGSILVHGVADLGWPWLYDTIHRISVDLAAGAGGAAGFVEWAVTAAGDFVVGLVAGLLLIPIATRLVGPGIAWATAKA